MTNNERSTGNPRRSMRLHLTWGVTTTAFLFLGVGGWAATTELAGAVIAPGFLVVDSNVKKVQHPTGGVVGELRVRDGDPVKRGDIVVRLDETQTKANLAIITKSLDENGARQARLEAERDGTENLLFSADLLARMSDPEVARLVQGEQRFFGTRRAAREGQVAQLRERIAQLNEQIIGLNVQVVAKKREIELIGQELQGVRELWQKKLVPFTRVVTLERDAARLEGEHGQFISSIAQAKAKITETEYQILQIDQDLRTEVGKELADIRGKTSELVEKRVAAEDQLKRIDIRAPQDGIVHQLAVHTVGGVITPQGEPIMLIVPGSDVLMAESKVEPKDIDQLHLGQKAVLRLSAFNQRTTPELNGEVSRISADVTEDPKTRESHYTIRIAIPERELARLGSMKLLPGMPIEVFVQTGERDVVSYLVKPFRDQIARAFRSR